MAPFAEFSGQGPLFLGQRLSLQILEALMHQIKGVIDQLGSLFGGHVAHCGGANTPLVVRL